MSKQEGFRLLSQKRLIYSQNPSREDGGRNSYLPVIESRITFPDSCPHGRSDYYIRIIIDAYTISFLCVYRFTVSDSGGKFFGAFFRISLSGSEHHKSHHLLHKYCYSRGNSQYPGIKILVRVSLNSSLMKTLPFINESRSAFVANKTQRSYNIVKNNIRTARQFSIPPKTC